MIETVGEFVKTLKCVNGRLPVVVVDSEGKMENLAWEYSDDGGVWNSFSLHLNYGERYKDRLATADTDVLKFIFDYCLNDPYRKPSFFSDDIFSEYTIKIAWYGLNCWRETDIIGTEIDNENRRFAIFVEKLPDAPTEEEKKESEDIDNIIKESCEDMEKKIKDLRSEKNGEDASEGKENEQKSPAIP